MIRLIENYQHVRETAETVTISVGRWSRGAPLGRKCLTLPRAKIEITDEGIYLSDALLNEADPEQEVCATPIS